MKGWRSEHAFESNKRGFSCPPVPLVKDQIGLVEPAVQG
jgi:hypothetical protein